MNNVKQSGESPAAACACPALRAGIAAHGRAANFPVKYKKKSIPADSRREVALNNGAIPGQVVSSRCSKCPATGTIYWPNKKNGSAGGWVCFSGLELDHIKPEFHGGSSKSENLQLLCRRCNRKKAKKIP